MGDTGDRLGELCLEQERQISVLECNVGLVNNLAKELASSTSFEPHLPKLLLPGLIS